ncbi:hypothetical protein [Nocardioides sp. MH1]|uniref:hypothetical protein n=1 Tax=Nocardioides sp. MH1 TaxID=3242490 RepID=UPI003522B548
MDRLLDFLAVLFTVLVGLLAAGLILMSDDPHSWFIGIGIFLAMIVGKLAGIHDVSKHQSAQLQYLVEVAADMPEQ